MLHDFHEEYAMEAFKSKDLSGTGCISALDFQEIMVSVKKHLLTEDVKDNLVAVSDWFNLPFFILLFFSRSIHFRVLGWNRYIYVWITFVSMIQPRI